MPTPGVPDAPMTQVFSHRSEAVTFFMPSFCLSPVYSSSRIINNKRIAVLILQAVDCRNSRYPTQRTRSPGKDLLALARDVQRFTTHHGAANWWCNDRIDVALSLEEVGVRFAACTVCRWRWPVDCSALDRCCVARSGTEPCAQREGADYVRSVPGSSTMIETTVWSSAGSVDTRRTCQLFTCRSSASVESPSMRVHVMCAAPVHSASPVITAILGDDLYQCGDARIVRRRDICRMIRGICGSS